MASLSPKVQDVCAGITQLCLACVTDLRGVENFWCSDLKRLLTSETQLSNLCLGSSNTRRMPRHCNGYELQYWTWAKGDKLMRLIQSKCWIHSSQMSLVQQVPVTNALAGAALLSLSPAGCKSGVSPSSSAHVFTHLPGPLTQVSCFLSLLLYNYKWQQFQTLNILLSWIWQLPALETYVLAPRWHMVGELPTQGCSPPPLPMWRCWRCSSGKLVAFCRLWLVCLCRLDLRCCCDSLKHEANGMLHKLVSCCSGACMSYGNLHLVDLLIQGCKKEYLMFVLHVCVCQSNNLIFYFFILYFTLYSVWITKNTPEQCWNHSRFYNWF